MIDTKFPRWADSPPQFLAWEVDELFFPTICLVFSLPARSIFTGLIIGIVLMRLYRRIKETKPSNFIMHWLWVYGIYQPKTREIILPKGHIYHYQE